MNSVAEILVKLKQNVVFFENFSDAELLEILKMTKREIFEEEQVVFKEGTTGVKMYIILTGKIIISRSIGKGEHQVLVELESGSLFGEMGPINGAPRSAQAKASEKTILLSLEESIIKRTNIALAYKLFKNFAAVLAERLRLSNQRLVEMSIADRSALAKLKDLVKKKISTPGGLKGVNLRGADLKGVFLSNTDLRQSIFIGAKMHQAKLTNANISDSYFVNADLSGADMRGVVFNKVNFAGADFSGTNFTDALIQDPNFMGADLSEANLENSSIVTTGKKTPEFPNPKYRKH